MKKVFYYKLLLLFAIFLSSVEGYGQSAITAKLARAIPCDSSTGAMILSGQFDAGTNYQVVYHITGKSGNDTLSIKATATEIIISGLKAGVYSHLMVINDGTVSHIKGHVIIRDGCHQLATWVDPTCDGINGEIEIPVDGDGKYAISYHLDGEKNNTIHSDGKIFNVKERDIVQAYNGSVTFRGLRAGTYTHIEVIPLNVVEASDDKDYKVKKIEKLGEPIKIFPVVLKSNKKDCIAAQKTEFMGAAYQNFTGIQDDDPEGFTQVYARLTQPLNKAQGISKNAKASKRFIPLRNLLFQITYGNTDNFKMYTTDFFGTRYVNRLDLLAHSYFNGCLNLNLITYVMPEVWKINKGDMAHVYLDAFSSLITTNVIDSTKPGNTQTYNIKSNIFGLNGKVAFNSVFNSDFNIEVGGKLFWLLPSSKVVNGSLNPQNPDVPASNDPMLNYVTKQDSATLNSFIVKGKNVAPYYTFEALVRYNTSKVAGNGSNIFLHYQYTSNIVGNKNGNYQNNYWQFQLGYALDINTIFPPKTAAATTDTTGKDDLAPADTTASPAGTTTATTTPAPAVVTTVTPSPVAIATVTPAPGDLTDSVVKSEVMAIWDSIKSQRARLAFKIKTIDSAGTFYTQSERYVRSKPLLRAKSVGYVKAGVGIVFTGYTDDGEDFEGVKRWYRIDDTHWFWAGEATKATTKKANQKKSATKTQLGKDVTKPSKK